MTLPSKTLPNMAAILLAGGTGSRFSTDTDKLLVNLRSKPVLAYSATALFSATHITQCILVCPEFKKSQYLKHVELTNGVIPVDWVNCGDTRRHSVYNALQAVKPSVNWVLIHDAARPLVSTTQINQFVATFSGQGGAAFACPVTDTIKQQTPTGQWITLPRETLWATQTPQLFDKVTLVQAHAMVNQPVTDDLQLLELAQVGPTSLWLNSLPNAKMTYPQDAVLLEQLIDKNRINDQTGY